MAESRVDQAFPNGPCLARLVSSRHRRPSPPVWPSIQDPACPPICDLSRSLSLAHFQPFPVRHLPATRRQAQKLPRRTKAIPPSICSPSHPQQSQSEERQAPVVESPHLPLAATPLATPTRSHRPASANHVPPPLHKAMLRQPPVGLRLPFCLDPYSTSLSSSTPTSRCHPICHLSHR